MTRKAVPADFAPVRTAGRPKKGLNTLPDGWREAFLSLYEQGKSDVAVRNWVYRQNKFRISNDLWQRWLKEEPIFSDTVKMGKLLAQEWWENAGQLMTMGAVKGNGVVWHLNVKNRFGFTDEVSLKVEVSPLDAIAKTVNEQSLLPSNPETKQLPSGSIIDGDYE